MKHFYQRLNECALCSACMATGKDYEEWSDKFESEFGCTWADAINKRTSVWKTTEFMQRILGKDVYETGVSLPRSGTKRLGSMRRRPRLGGKGILTFLVENQYDRHAVAYCSGIIYDSSCHKPLSWIDWVNLRSHRRWQVDGHHKITS